MMQRITFTTCSCDAGDTGASTILSCVQRCQGEVTCKRWIMQEKRSVHQAAHAMVRKHKDSAFKSTDCRALTASTRATFEMSHCRVI